MRDLLTNLLASVIAGAAVWLAQWAVRYRRLARQRAFFALAAGETAQMAVARHYTSPRENSVHRQDVAALVELATIARECGARSDLADAAELAQGFGRMTEFCVGGPGANPRTATHLRTMLHGVTFDRDTIHAGGLTYRHSAGAEYVVLARAWGPGGGKPVFVLAGQSATTNLAAAVYLGRRRRELARAYRGDRPFCLVLEVVEPAVYGTEHTVQVADVSATAFRPGRTGRMDILVAGGHGQVALRLLGLLADRGHRARGLIRKPEQAAALEAVGAEPVLGDLETDATLEAYVRGADAVVFAAGAGPGSGPARKRTVDLGGAVKLADAAAAEGVRRYVLVSSVGADRPDAAAESMRPYLEAKAEADDYVRASGLDWTIVRPGALTDEPGTGLIRVSRGSGGRGPVPRDDVAAVLAACLTTPATIGQTFELFAGDTPIDQALMF